MCFSASASFVAGIGLSIVGVMTLKKTKQKIEVPFAMIPLLFGFQQLIEGILWLSFRFDSPLLTTITTYLFSLFSHSIWPIFVPLSVWLLEVVPWRRNVIAGFLAIGISIGLYLLFLIVKFPVTAEVNEHIIYISPHFYKMPAIIFYVAATCIVSLFSSHKIMNIFGALALVLFAIASWFYTVALFSVWCFFSAILSFMIYLYFRSKYPVRYPGIFRSL
jgi:hypothetical protein